ncbi:MAG: hypothetical protein RML94_09880 [Bacteroidia bacterium]|nr:hypothetical protein [Bacteroidia bacterium]
MVKLKIIKISDNTLFGQFVFPNIAEAESYVDYIEKNKLYQNVQLMDRVEIIPAKKELQPNPDNPEEMIEVEIEPEQQIIHPATHRYEIEDISAQMEEKEKLIKRIKNIDFGTRLVALIGVHNQNANLPQLEQILLDNDFIIIRELLYSGSIESAKAKLLAIEEKAKQVFGEGLYDKILQEINIYLYGA